MPLKLILVAPEGTVFTNGHARDEVVRELAAFIGRMSTYDVRVAIWSRHHWITNGETLDAHLTRLSGVPVRHFAAASGNLKARQYGGSADPILAELGVQRHETILLGSGPTDLQAGVNNSLLLVRPGWYGDEMDYGFRVSSISRLARFCEVFALRAHPIFWSLDSDRVHVRSMGPYSTYRPDFAVFGADARSVAKDNVGDTKFWFLMIVSSLYFSGLAHTVDYICPFPGHDPNVSGSTRALLDQVMSRFAKCFRKPYLPDLIVRHTKSLSSHSLTASQRTFVNHLNTVNLNKWPRRYDKAEPPRASLSLRKKAVLVVDDFLTNGRSLDVARAYINAAGGEAVLFSWLKTINSPYHSMVADPTLKPYEVNSVAHEPGSVVFDYHTHVGDAAAPKEIQEVFDAYRDWK
jgi:hypothetical protein